MPTNDTTIDTNDGESWGMTGNGDCQGVSLQGCTETAGNGGTQPESAYETAALPLSYVGLNGAEPPDCPGYRLPTPSHDTS